MKQLIILLTINLAVSFGYCQNAPTFTAPVSGTVIEPGSTIQVGFSTNDVVFYEFGGKKPNENSPSFVGSASLVVPSFGSSEFARINTTASDPEYLDDWMPADMAMPDSLFEAITSVEKISTLWLSVNGNDTVFHYPASQEDGFSVYITADPADLYSDSIGILVDGDGDLVPDTISFGFDQNGVIYFETNPVEYIEADISDEYIVPSGNDSLVFQGPFMVCDAVECTEVYSMLLDTVTGSGSVTIMSFGDQITIEIMLTSLVHVSDSTSITFYFVQLHTPNFTLSGELFDWYPEINDNILYRKAHVSIIDNGVLAYEGKSRIRVFGGMSAFAPAKSLRMKFPSDNRLDYPAFSPNEEKNMDLRKFGWQQYTGANELGNFILNEARVGVPSGVYARLYLNGEYHGYYNFKEVSGQHFAEELFPSIDDDDVAFYFGSDITEYDLNERAIPFDCHRDSMAVRMERFEDDYTWLINADKQDPGFRNALKARFNYQSLFKVKFLSAFAERGDYGPQNSEFFSDNTGTLPYYWIAKDFDGSFPCWLLNYDSFTHQLFDLTDSTDIMQTVILNSMMENDSVRFDCQNLASDMGSTTLLPENLLGKWSSLTQAKYPYMDQNFERWGSLPYAEVDAAEFYQHDLCVREFLESRTGVMYGFMNDIFETDTTRVRFRTVTGCGDATAFVSTMSAPDSVWVYRTSFTGIPVPLYADGYDFQYWIVNSDTVQEENFYRVFHPDTVYDVTAVFGCFQIDANIVSLRVSEVLPDNETVLADPQGDFDDYIELFNSSNSSVDLEGFYLSDKLSELDKYQFGGNFLLEPQERVLFWADNDVDDGVFHTSFKLDKDGEAVYISDGVTVIDSIVWDFTIPEDSSYGYCPAGGVLVMEPTPGTVNQCQIVSIDEANEGIPSTYDHMVIFDLLGRVVKSDVERLPAGVYIRTYQLKGEVLFSEKFAVQN